MIFGPPSLIDVGPDVDVDQQQQTSKEKKRPETKKPGYSKQNVHHNSCAVARDLDEENGNSGAETVSAAKKRKEQALRGEQMSETADILDNLPSLYRSDSTEARPEDEGEGVREGGTEKKGGTEDRRRQAGSEGGTEKKGGTEDRRRQAGSEGGTEKKGGTEDRRRQAGSEGGTEKKGGTEDRRRQAGSDGGTEKKGGTEDRRRQAGSEGGTEKKGGTKDRRRQAGSEGGTEKKGGTEDRRRQAGSDGGTEKKGGTEDRRRQAGSEGGTEKKGGTKDRRRQAGSEGGTEKKGGTEDRRRQAGSDGGTEKKGGTEDRRRQAGSEGGTEKKGGTKDRRRQAGSEGGTEKKGGTEDRRRQAGSDGGTEKKGGTEDRRRQAGSEGGTEKKGGTEDRRRQAGSQCHGGVECRCYLFEHLLNTACARGDHVRKVCSNRQRTPARRKGKRSQMEKTAAEFSASWDSTEKQDPAHEDEPMGQGQRKKTLTRKMKEAQLVGDHSSEPKWLYIWFAACNQETICQARKEVMPVDKKAIKTGEVVTIRDSQGDHQGTVLFHTSSEDYSAVSKFASDYERSLKIKTKKEGWNAQASPVYSPAFIPVI
ncbi:hypothetical protein Bbelb_036180 [Branchiostoma belcheri]|nr:hypothetical protein Bbelb_036180 [Branchiostoma belcheri]